MTPWRHQLQAFHFASKRPATMLALDMGTGKTKVTIDVLQNAGAKRVLVICPKTVVSVWPNEFAKHCAVEYKVLPLNRGSIGKRVGEARLTYDQYQQTGSDKMLVFVVNYEATWRDEMAKFLTSVDWDFIVCDESHRIKSYNGTASKFIGKLGAKARRRLCLTGTPMPHSPLDAFGQYRFLDPAVFGTSYHLFKNTYANWGGYGGHELVGYRNTDELNKRFYSIAFRVGKEVLELPEYNHVERTFTLEGKALQTYNELEQDFISFVSKGEVTVSNALVKLLRLQQITSGHIPVDDGAIVDLHDQKGEQLADLLEDIDANEPVVVFARFRRDLDRIRAIAEKSNRGYFELSGRHNEMAEWQSATGGEIIGVQMQSGGVGVDLTRASKCVYWSLGFSLGEFEQSLARTHRPGQTRPVTYIHLIAEGTVDRKVYNALRDKREVVESILEDLT
jgi:SNF2 family DNA or RNA helicase